MYIQIHIQHLGGLGVDSAVGLNALDAVHVGLRLGRLPHLYVPCMYEYMYVPVCVCVCVVCVCTCWPQPRSTAAPSSRAHS